MIDKKYILFLMFFFVHETRTPSQTERWADAEDLSETNKSELLWNCLKRASIILGRRNDEITRVKLSREFKKHYRKCVAILAEDTTLAEGPAFFIREDFHMLKVLATCNSIDTKHFQQDAVDFVKLIFSLFSRENCKKIEYFYKRIQGLDEVENTKTFISCGNDLGFEKTRISKKMREMGIHIEEDSFVQSSARDQNHAQDDETWDVIIDPDLAQRKDDLMRLMTQAFEHLAKFSEGANILTHDPLEHIITADHFDSTYKALSQCYLDLNEMPEALRRSLTASDLRPLVDSQVISYLSTKYIQNLHSPYAELQRLSVRNFFDSLSGLLASFVKEEDLDTLFKESSYLSNLEVIDTASQLLYAVQATFDEDPDLEYGFNRTPVNENVKKLSSLLSRAPGTVVTILRRKRGKTIDSIFKSLENPPPRPRCKARMQHLLTMFQSIWQFERPDIR